MYIVFDKEGAIKFSNGSHVSYPKSAEWSPDWYSFRSYSCFKL